jgi:hypothetical protein
MTHVVGTVQQVSPFAQIGPDSGLPPTSPNTWAFALDPGIPANGPVKFVIVHFALPNLPANNRVEVDLGYGTDVFKAADGFDFWSRPVNVAAFADGKVPIRYMTDGAATGSVQIDRFGRGERQAGDGDPASLSNCDPFLLDENYAEPNFSPALICIQPPKWENADCVAAGDIRKTVSPSVGMILFVDLALDGTTEIVTSASGTLVGADFVLTTAQAMAFVENKQKSASIIFNYQTNCDGSRPNSYAPRFHKIIRVIQTQLFGGIDYALAQLRVPAAGLGIAPITMRPDLPAPGEQIFCLHHPEGAVKRLSAPSAGFQTVLVSSATEVRANLDAATGSIGAGLFDIAGRIIGVLSAGPACNLAFFPTAGVLQDVANPSTEPTFRDVVIVFDRSGSMSSDAGTGRSKIEEARDAASLFIQLIQSDSGNSIGLVSFSTTASAPADFALTQVSDASRLALVGPAPFTTGIVGALTPGGSTSIGGGLQAGQQALLPGFQIPAILLLTDGLQNRPPLIADVTGLDNVIVNAIGFGAESGLNGALLTELAETHKGLYMRAGDGLALKKYFALAFGNIFTSGALLDPEAKLAANQSAGQPIKFQVLGEDVITIVAGWDKPGSTLAIRVKTPAGATVTATTQGVAHATGPTWTFLRIKLPRGQERDGTWTATVERAGKFPRRVALRYFVTVIAGGGVKLTRPAGPDRYFTGDVIAPSIRLASRDKAFPANASVRLTVRRPDTAAGNLLMRQKLRAAAVQSGDTLPVRHSTLQALEKAAGKALIGASEHRFELKSQAAARASNSVSFAQTLKDLLTVEGTYTFHAVAAYGKEVVGTRETQWSVHVEPGVDQAKSDVKIAATVTRPDKRKAITFTIVPRDRYGNHFGPDRADAFLVTGARGTTITAPLRDNGDGSYTVSGLTEATAKPGVVLDRPPPRPRKA